MTQLKVTVTEGNTVKDNCMNGHEGYKTKSCLFQITIRFQELTPDLELRQHSAGKS